MDKGTKALNELTVKVRLEPRSPEFQVREYREGSRLTYVPTPITCQCAWNAVEECCVRLAMSAVGVGMGSRGSAATYVPSLAWIIVYSIFYLKEKNSSKEKDSLLCVCFKTGSLQRQ